MGGVNGRIANDMHSELLRSNTTGEVFISNDAQDTTGHDNHHDLYNEVDGDQDDERKSNEDISCEYSTTDTPVLSMGSLANRKRSKNLIGSYSTTMGSKSTTTSTSA